VIILFVKQRLLYQKEDLVEFLEEKKSMTWSKKSEFFDIQLNYTVKK
jgi:uncharacterized protein YfaQ (DUF2300 family)